MAPYYSKAEQKVREEVRDWVEERRPKLMTWVDAVNHIQKADGLDDRDAALAQLRKALADGLHQEGDYDTKGGRLAPIFGGIDFIDDHLKDQPHLWLSESEVRFDFEKGIVIVKALIEGEEDNWWPLLVRRADIERFWPMSSQTQAALRKRAYWRHLKAVYAATGFLPGRADDEKWASAEGFSRDDVRSFREILPEFAQKGGRRRKWDKRIESFLANLAD